MRILPGWLLALVLPWSTFALTHSYTVPVVVSLHTTTLAQPVTSRSWLYGRLNNEGPPAVNSLELITKLPDTLPQRITGFAYDGKKFWAMIYLGRGHFATLDPISLTWSASESEEQHRAIKRVAGKFESPGSVCFAEGRLWIGGAYGESFGSIDLQKWTVSSLFKGSYREQPGTQSYASMAFDGHHLWVAWHWTRYDLPVSETQQLLKVDRETGNVVASYALPAGTATELTHGLTWDGKQLWHMKDSMLSAIDPGTGTVTATYLLDQIKRPSGLAWDGKALWISEFEGRIWRLTFAG